MSFFASVSGMAVSSKSVGISSRGFGHVGSTASFHSFDYEDEEIFEDTQELKKEPVKEVPFDEKIKQFMRDWVVKIQ